MAGGEVSLLVALLLSAAPPVGLVAEGCDAPFVELVRTELSVAGLPATAMASGAPAEAGELLRLHLSCSDGAVDVAVDDHVTRKRVERRVSRPAEVRGATRAAVQVVELLHASLAEARFRTEGPVPPQVEAFLTAQEPEPPPPSWRVSVEAGVAVAPGGFGAQPHLAGTVARKAGTFELSARLAATVHATRLTGRGGSAEVGLLDARVTAGLPMALGPAILELYAGAGALAVWSAGRAGWGYVPRAGVTATFAPSLGFVATVWPLPWLGVTGVADVVLTPVPVRVRFPDGAGARIGLPVVSLGVGVRLR